MKKALNYRRNLARIKPTTIRHLVRTEDASWVSQGARAALTFSDALIRPFYLTFLLKFDSEACKPTFRFGSWPGDSFTSSRQVGSSVNALYIVHAPGFFGLGRVQFEPSKLPCRFSLEVRRFWLRDSVDGYVQTVLREFSDNGVAILCEDVASTRKYVLRDYFINVAHHYNKVQRIAADTHFESDSGHQWRTIPLFSIIVPLYNTPPKYLNTILKTFRQQPSGSCELILSDDGSTSESTLRWLRKLKGTPLLKIVRSTTNQGIAAATNSGLRQACATWVMLLDHDDALAPHAVRVIANAINKNPAAQFIYTDEVVTNKNLRPTDYFLKPAYDSVLLSGVNYINHLSCYRRERLNDLGGLGEGFDGSQDYELLLRYLRDLTSPEILHVPFPAYLWRRSRNAFSHKNLKQATLNARRALTGRYNSNDRVAYVGAALNPNLHRIQFEDMNGHWPKVTAIIPTKDAFHFIETVLNGLFEKTDYPFLEIILVDNGSTDPRVLKLYDSLRSKSHTLKIFISEESFNYSKQVNRGLLAATGDLILLLNNDIEVDESGWLKEMVACFGFDGVGIVGAKLLYPDQTIQHAGVIVGLGRYAAHWFSRKPRMFPGPMGRLWVRQSLSAVTGACMLISRRCLDDVGRFDESELPIAYSDIDFCLRAFEKRYRIIWTPFATLIHHESASRGSDEHGENSIRFAKEKQILLKRHKTDRYEDRAFSPWYSKDDADARLVILPQLPKAR